MTPLDYESSIIKLLLNDNSTYADVDLEPKDFQNANIAIVYDIIGRQIASGAIADICTVADQLQKETGKDAYHWLTNLVLKTIEPHDIQYACGRVRLGGQVAKACEIAKGFLNDPWTETAIDEVIDGFTALAQCSERFEYSIQDGLKLAVKAIEEHSNVSGPIGVTTGIRELDFVLDGYHKSDFTVIGARPSIGKTSVMINQILAPGVPVGVFSSEQPLIQIVNRCLASQGGVALTKIRSGKLDNAEWGRIGEAANEISKKNIVLCDKPTIGMEEIYRIARRWQCKYDIKAVYIDYLQRIKGDPRLKENERVGKVAAQMKGLARALDIPVICLAQVSRECEKRPDKRPTNSDLGESGKIEREADNIIMLYRDSVYTSNDSPKEQMEFIITKNRHGPTKTVYGIWDGPYVRIRE